MAGVAEEVSTGASDLGPDMRAYQPIVRRVKAKVKAKAKAKVKAKVGERAWWVARGAAVVP
ncbi:hypothetical protein GCM10010211_54640 [Streptomyces albospinus]|uniref:Uncharacterized protein n=1 Tax=Streptomyces albospinus TaxID=285515 RepID=A0ABQ2VFQ0_9ACTN|nr:hypothetical protein GCM10010211_54640 [Streptomyces albospinus]